MVRLRDTTTSATITGDTTTAATVAGYCNSISFGLPIGHAVFMLASRDCGVQIWSCGLPTQVVVGCRMNEEHRVWISSGLPTEIVVGNIGTEIIFTKVDIGTLRV